MANLARFTINGSPSSDRGYDVNPGETPTFSLEVSSSLIHRVTYEVRPVSADAGAPRASSGAPTLTLSNGVATGQTIDAVSPSSPVTVSAGIPSLRNPHLWEVRCRVNDGRNPDASINPDYWFSRFIAMRSGLGLRKIVPTERSEYDPIDGWAGALNETVIALSQTEILAGFKAQLALESTASVVAISPGSVIAPDPSGLVTRVGTGSFQVYCPFMTIDGVGYHPDVPLISLMSGAAIVSARVQDASTTVLELFTLNSSLAAATISGVRVNLWVPYRRMA